MFLFSRTTGVSHDSFALWVGLPHPSYRRGLLLDAISAWEYRADRIWVVAGST